METRIIELNRAAADDLLEANIEALEEKHISDLIAYREQYGPFESWEEVNDVPGFTQELVDRMKSSGVILGEDESAFTDPGTEDFS
jgi:competence ComEA-like helix-hairpin-helix protein